MEWPKMHQIARGKWKKKNVLLGNNLKKLGSTLELEWGKLPVALLPRWKWGIIH
jgi:hypothetical protein